jgi:hypothetical protein
MAPTIATHTVKALTKMLAVVSIVSFSRRVFRKGLSRPDDEVIVVSVGGFDCEPVHSRRDLSAPTRGTPRPGERRRLSGANAVETPPGAAERYQVKRRPVLAPPSGSALT